MKIQIGKKVYSSVERAARAKGVAPGTIYSALHRGTLENVGQGQGKAPAKTHNGGREKKPLQIGPVAFPSQMAAAKALGYHPSSLSKIRAQGKNQSKQELLARAIQYYQKEMNNV